MTSAVVAETFSSPMMFDDADLATEFSPPHYASSDDNHAASSFRGSNKRHYYEGGDDNRRPLKRQYCQQPRRIQCKARGLSKTHNAKTAYFEIPSNTPHGMLLSCSHTECQASGRKFRYCKVCCVPVAKRNFIRRHGHGLVDSTRVLKESVDRADIGCSLTEEDDNYDQDGPTTSPASEFSAHERAEKDGNDDKKPSSLRRAVSFEGLHFKPIVVESRASQPDAPPQRSAHLSDYERAWLSLLHTCPSLEDQRSMTRWVDQVIDHAAVFRPTSRPHHAAARYEDTFAPTDAYVTTTSSPDNAYHVQSRTSAWTDDLEPLEVHDFSGAAGDPFARRR